MSEPTTDNSLAIAALREMAEMKGQVAALMQLTQHNHNATQQRIDDLRHSVEGRLAGHEARLERLEDNERGTAIRAGSAGAVAGTIASVIVAATVQAIKHGS